MIKLSHITKSYKIDDETVFTALYDTSLSIKEGELVSIIGPSGSGKSTLMHIIGLLDKPTSGDVLINGQDIAKLSDDELSELRHNFVGFVFQQFNLINKLTIIENVLLPTVYARTPVSFSPRDKAMELLKRLGIESKANSYPNKISGGQQQRVAIARALIMNPQLILADEPTGNLDTKTGKEILTLLKELNIKDKITVVLVTHDPEVASQANRTIKIQDGKVL
ncbi:ABC transporter ATP-binding protein [Candidatus Woesebacteria bacterium]|jgi:ABC-type lipoprotein export system ATPase subunit|nr:ABC transporter ATP-binding protein [Candidatus Woesebacteria bacterium]